MKSTITFSIVVELPDDYDFYRPNQGMEQDIIQDALEQLEVKHGEVTEPFN